MRYRNLCGRQTAVIALGTMDFGGKIEEGRAREFMDAYVELGGNFIDTARVYGDFVREIQGGSERVIGRWMEERRCREEIVLATKGGHPDMHAMHTGRLSRAEVLDDIQRSLDNLRTDCVDIYWLHRDDRSRPVEDILTTLTELRERGMTRHVGLSNWTPARIREAIDCARARNLAVPAANQPQFSLARQVVVEDDTLCQMDAETYRLHAAESLPCVAFSSQAKGFLAKIAAGAALTDKARRRFDCPENLAVLARVKELHRQTGISVAAISLAWLTAQPFPTFPIAGASCIEQVRAIAEAGDATLTPEQRDSLRAF